MVVICVALLAGLPARTVPPRDVWGILVAYGRYAATWVGQNEIIYVGEGVTASVAVSRTPNGVLNYHNAGKVQASSEPQDMRLQRMLGHITTLVPKNPGAAYPRHRLRRRGDRRRGLHRPGRQATRRSPRSSRSCRKVVSTYFSEHNFDVVRNPKVNVHL